MNVDLRVSDRAGNDLVTVGLEDFFGISAIPDYDAEVFDPRVIFDSHHSRWIVIEASFDCLADPDAGVQLGMGYLDIATSLSADPFGDWELFSFFYNDSVPDYPGIGTTTDKIVFSANVIPLESATGGLGCQPAESGFIGSRMDVVAWSEWLGSGGVYVDHFASGNHFTWRPALQSPATSPIGHAIAVASNDGVAYARITGTPAGGGVTTFTVSDLTASGVVAAFASPPSPRQPGPPTTIADAVDLRPTDAIWQGDRLAFVSTYPCDPAGGIAELRDCVRVSELSTAAPTPSLIQDFFISEEAADHYMGGIGYAGNGDLHIVWTRSSEAGEPRDYPISWTANQLATMGTNEISNPIENADQLEIGNYPGSRWGRYVGVAQDPQVPNAVWQANEHATGEGWATQLTRLQTGGSSYIPITPLRVVDSRVPNGVPGVFNANSPRSFQVASVGSIPADAIAVTGNVTVTGQTAAGFVSVTPTATSTPSSSTLNFPLGDTRANNFTASLDSAGKLAAVYKAASGKRTHVIVDITGYFLAGNEDATYVPATPVRVMDTRPASHVGTATHFTAGVPQTLAIAGESGIPITATAITGNLTVVGQSKAGYLSVTPDPPLGIPGTSTLNFPAGDLRANGLTADLNADGELSVTYTAFAGATTHALLDVTGYYVDHAGALLFYPLNPGRVLDTRSNATLSGLSGAFDANAARTLNVGTHWGVDIGAEAITGNLTVVGQTGAGFVAMTPAPTSSPSTSSLNFPVGDVRANGLTGRLFAGDTGLVYKAASGKTTHLLLDVTGYFK